MNVIFVDLNIPSHILNRQFRLVFKLAVTRDGWRGKGLLFVFIVSKREIIELSPKVTVKNIETLRIHQAVLDAVAVSMVPARPFLVGVNTSSKEMADFRFPLGVGVNTVGGVSAEDNPEVKITYPELGRTQSQEMLLTKYQHETVLQHLRL